MLKNNLNSLINTYSDSPYLKSILLSVFLIILYLVAKKFFHNKIDQRAISKVEKAFIKKRSTIYLRYFALAILVLFWFSHLQVFLVSLIAVAAAIVIAFKELIMCFTGGVLIRSSRPFTTSQRIDLGDTRGFVVNSGLLTTKILEIGPEKNSQQTTGDMITIPNSIMLSKAIKNESYFKDYSIKSYQFKVKKLDQVESFEGQLRQKASEFCSSYLEEAKNRISEFCEKEGIAIPSVAPRTKLILDEDDRNFIVLAKVPVQNSSIGDLEQELNRFYLNWRIKVGDLEDYNYEKL